MIIFPVFVYISENSLKIFYSVWSNVKWKKKNFRNSKPTASVYPPSQSTANHHKKTLQSHHHSKATITQTHHHRPTNPANPGCRPQLRALIRARVPPRCPQPRASIQARVPPRRPQPRAHRPPRGETDHLLRFLQLGNGLG